MSKKSIIIIIFLFLIYFIFYSISYSYSISQELEETVFRLHIIANSDSKEDQELKLHVRDNVIEYLNQFSFSSKEDLIKFLNENTSKIENVVQKSINEKGYSYPFSIEICNSFFPKKEYNNIDLPSGKYDGLKIKIGNSNGKNWWCVLFPPMCLIDSTTCKLPEESNLVLEESISEETYSTISSNTKPYTFKFKIVDFINNIYKF